MVVSILCGGSGTRLFPLSRELLPKQFAQILPKESPKSATLMQPRSAHTPNPQTNGTSAKSPHSLFQETLLRNLAALRELNQNPKLQVITNEALFFLAKDQAQDIGVEIEHFILESCGKNTAPALAIAALHARKHYGDDEIILALPSDHLIAPEHYASSIEQAIVHAKNNQLVTFGIAPTSPHTGYGYIRVEQGSGRVLGFYEKPESSKACEYVDSGEYFWNSGMFCFKASTLLEGLREHASGIYLLCEEIFAKSQSTSIDGEECVRLDRTLSEKLSDESIDYALMEKAQNIACVASQIHWSDVGSFESLREEYPKDAQNNATNTHFIAKNSKDNFVLSSRPVVGVGISDMIVIDSDDCLLISKAGESAGIKELLPLLRETYPELTRTHRTTYRPWGSYTILLESSFYKIKQIIVKPKSRLSLQKHFHRNEHWIIVNGSAIVQIGESEVFLQTNQSTYIPMGQPHRLENPGKIPLVLIEVQMGEYLGEDDIVRLADDYQRS